MLAVSSTLKTLANFVICQWRKMALLRQAFSPHLNDVNEFEIDTNIFVKYRMHRTQPTVLDELSFQ